MSLKTNINKLGSIHRLSPSRRTSNTNRGSLPIITSLKHTAHFFFFCNPSEIENHFPPTVKMLHVAVFERERYLRSANTSNSLAVQAGAPEARVVNSISCMFIVVARDILRLFLCAVGRRVGAVVKRADGVAALITAGQNFNSAAPPQRSANWYHPSPPEYLFLTQLGNWFFSLGF